jgi:hypothetical protein
MVSPGATGSLTPQTASCVRSGDPSAQRTEAGDRTLPTCRGRQPLTRPARHDPKPFILNLETERSGTAAPASGARVTAAGKKTCRYPHRAAASSWRIWESRGIPATDPYADRVNTPATVAFKPRGGHGSLPPSRGSGRHGSPNDREVRACALSWMEASALRPPHARFRPIPGVRPELAGQAGDAWTSRRCIGICPIPHAGRAPRLRRTARPSLTVSARDLSMATTLSADAMLAIVVQVDVENLYT